MTPHKSSFMQREIKPFWAWFILVMVLFYIFSFHGFEEAVMSGIAMILWHKMVIEK